jgi:hypothetical protein
MRQCWADETEESDAPSWGDVIYSRLFEALQSSTNQGIQQSRRQTISKTMNRINPF